jgi:hypothetical protein
MVMRSRRLLVTTARAYPKTRALAKTTALATCGALAATLAACGSRAVNGYTSRGDDPPYPPM